MGVKSVYIIGALKNRNVMTLAQEIRKLGFDVFDDWITPGPLADQYLLKYEKQRGHNYHEALNGRAANHIFEFDYNWLLKCDIAILLMKAGKSAHLELGFIRGLGKPGYVLFPKEPARFDLMYKLASGVYCDKKKLFKELRRLKRVR